MANSSWTENHVDAILSHSDSDMTTLHFYATYPPSSLRVGLLGTERTQKRPSKKRQTGVLVYSPCDTREMTTFSLNGRERPKKDHPAQLRAFAQLLADHPTYTSGRSSVKLVLLGGARNAEDRAR
ncbi:hypothetical protein M405DRAFT_823282, partial [Rhizopogon salebrosus TDB-379]